MNNSTGLYYLKQAGVPDSALTALLILLGGITFIPYVAGREFGPYTIPELLPPATYWLLTLTTPIVWLLLITSIFSSRKRFKRRKIILGLLVLCVTILAFLFSPKVEVVEFENSVINGHSSESVSVLLPAAQNIEVEFTEVSPNVDLGLSICLPLEKDCGPFLQRGVDKPVIQYSKAGKVSFTVHNYAVNEFPVNYTLSIKYVKRRYF